MWHEGMFGRYFSSHSGSIACRPVWPQRSKWNSWFSSGAGVGSALQDIRWRVHLVGTELDADAFVSQFRDLQAGVLKAKDRGEDSQLDVAAVDLEALSQTFEPLGFRGLIGEVSDLGTDASGSRGCRGSAKSERCRCDQP